MRELVGPTDPKQFDNPTGNFIYSYLPYITEENYARFFDFGCGCGRVARQLIQQKIPPTFYAGIDLHKGMIEWAQRNLAPAKDGFEFHHHDVYNVRFNPNGKQPPVASFPVGDKDFTMVHALSVFTHLTQMQTEFYLPEAARVLRDDGVFLSSWFLFDKAYFPFLPDGESALYVSYVDPSAAVIYDRQWVQDLASQSGLVISHIEPPWVRGHQWTLTMQPMASGATSADWPADEAPLGKSVAAAGKRDAHLIH
jgi:SAM-dependent methyltransferase